MREPNGSCFDPEVGWFHGTKFTCDICGATKRWADAWICMEMDFGWSINNATSTSPAMDMCDECIAEMS